MVYVYKIFGLILENKLEVAKLIEAMDYYFEPWEGLMSRIILSNVEEQIASVLFFCEDYESATIAKKRMKILVDRYNELIGWTHEAIFDVVDNKQIDPSFYNDNSSNQDIPFLPENKRMQMRARF